MGVSVKKYPSNSNILLFKVLSLVECREELGKDLHFGAFVQGPFVAHAMGFHKDDTPACGPLHPKDEVGVEAGLVVKAQAGLSSVAYEVKADIRVLVAMVSRDLYQTLDELPFTRLKGGVGRIRISGSNPFLYTRGW